MKRGEEKQKQIPMCESYDKILRTGRTTAIQIKFNAKQQKGDVLRLALTLWDKFIQFDMHRVVCMVTVGKRIQARNRGMWTIGLNNRIRSVSLDL